MKAPNYVDRFSRSSRFIYLILASIRFFALFAYAVTMQLFVKKSKSVIVFALPKSGSTAIEVYLNEELGLPVYIPLSGIVADFVKGNSHEVKMSDFDRWIIENLNVFVKTHLLPPSKLTLNKKVLYFALTRNIHQAAESALRHNIRYPRLLQSNYGEICTSFSYWENVVGKEMKIYSIEDFEEISKLLNNEFELDLSSTSLKISTEKLAAKYPDHFEGLKSSKVND